MTEFKLVKIEGEDDFYDVFSDGMFRGEIVLGHDGFYRFCSNRVSLDAAQVKAIAMKLEALNAAKTNKMAEGLPINYNTIDDIGRL